MERSETVRRLEMAKEILLLPEIPGVDEFDMSWWGSAESLDKDGNGCGTACCFGGALGLQPAFRELGFVAEWRKSQAGPYELDARDPDGAWWTYAEMGAEVFGIDCDEVNELFSSVPSDLDSYAPDERGLTKEFVAQRLDVLIARYSMPEAA